MAGMAQRSPVVHSTRMCGCKRPAYKSRHVYVETCRRCLCRVGKYKLWAESARWSCVRSDRISAFSSRCVYRTATNAHNRLVPHDEHDHIAIARLELKRSFLCVHARWEPRTAWTRGGRTALTGCLLFREHDNLQVLVISGVVLSADISSNFCNHNTHHREGNSVLRSLRHENIQTCNSECTLTGNARFGLLGRQF